MNRRTAAYCEINRLFFPCITSHNVASISPSIYQIKGYKVLNKNTYVLKAYLIFDIFLQVSNDGIMR